MPWCILHSQAGYSDPCRAADMVQKSVVPKQVPPVAQRCMHVFAVQPQALSHREYIITGNRALIHFSLQGQARDWPLAF